jgi:recombination protein RecR
MQVLGINALDRVINELSRLPGIGRKTAQRLAIHILKGDRQYADDLADSIRELKEETQLCERCFNIAEGSLCAVCTDTRRDQSKLCLVEDIVDIFAIEGSAEYNGLYHVLGGVISPLAGITADKLHLDELINRLRQEDIEEVLMALNPSTEGEATMIYISKLLRNMNIKVTRIASGVPFGSHLEFVDTATIGRAIATRREL